MHLGHQKTSPRLEGGHAAPCRPPLKVVARRAVTPVAATSPRSMWTGLGVARDGASETRPGGGGGGGGGLAAAAVAAKAAAATVAEPAQAAAAATALALPTPRGGAATSSSGSSSSGGGGLGLLGPTTVDLPRPVAPLPEWPGFSTGLPPADGPTGPRERQRQPHQQQQQQQQQQQAAAAGAQGLAVRARGVVKHFATAKGDFKAVRGVDVEIKPSSICALLGPSGSGKTTLLRLIAGLEAPTAGRIYFGGQDATDLPVQDRQVGMVFQSYALFNHMTVAENIRFGLEVRDLGVDREARVEELLALVQLGGLASRYPRQLSGGQRQRVALARALASDPKLLLLDEPFGALDAVVRKQLRSGLREIVRTLGVTTVIVTHDQEEAFDIADQVVIFNRGFIEQVGSPDDIIRRPATPFVMRFVGDTHDVPSSSLLVRRSRFITPKTRVMFRPGDVQLLPAAPRPGDARMTTPATVRERANLGWTVRLVLRFDDGVEIDHAVPRQAAEAGGPLDMAPGQRVHVHVRPEGMMGFEPAEVEGAPLP